MDSNNNNTTMLNNNKQLIEERKRKMTLEFSNPQINTESLNTPQLISILANDIKRLKPDSLPLQTPTQIIETPTIPMIDNRIIDKLIINNFLNLDAPLGTTLLPILSSTHKQKDFKTTPKNEKDMSALFDLALDNVQNHNTNNNKTTSTPSKLNTDKQKFSEKPVTRINLDYQGVKRIDEKRKKNRLAARKCRTRKLEIIATLEQQVKELNAKNVKTADDSNVLIVEINNLKKQLQQHRQIHGCEFTSI